MILIYALSGILMNHRGDLNPHYSVEVKEFKVTQDLSDKDKIDKALVLEVLQPLEEADNYTKHYFQKDGRMKVFLKGGSNLVVDTQTGAAVYEKLERRFLLSDMVKLSSVHWLTSWKFTSIPLVGLCMKPQGVSSSSTVA